MFTQGLGNPRWEGVTLCGKMSRLFRRMGWNYAPDVERSLRHHLLKMIKVTGSIYRYFSKYMYIHIGKRETGKGPLCVCVCVCVCLSMGGKRKQDPLASLPCIKGEPGTAPRD